MSKVLPSKITAGLTFKRRVSLDCYPAGDGWDLELLLRGPGSISETATVDAGAHLFLVGADETAQWKPGCYDYSVRASKAGEVHEADSGVVEIMPDLAASDAGIGLSHAERTLAAIEAVIEQRATLDQERYRINNRELYRTPIPDLLKLRDTYRAEVQRERQRARGGKEFGRAVKVIL